MLFEPEEVQIGNLSICQPGESFMAYVATRDKPEVEEYRKFLNRCFQHYPETDKARLRSELRSTKTPQQYGALLQMVTYLLLSHTGFTVVPEPVLNGCSPDFLVTNSYGDLLLVECVVDSGERDRSEPQERLNTVLTSARKHMRVPGYAIRIHEFVLTKTNPSPRQLATCIDRFLTLQNRDTLVTSWHYKDAPREVFLDNHGNRVEFSAIPLSNQSEIPAQIAGVTSGSFSFVDTSRPKDIIRKKTNQHKASIPTLIVYGCNDSSFTNEAEYDSALRTFYGNEVHVYRFNRNTGEIADSPVEVRRDKDGLWVPIKGRDHTKPSLVIWCENFLSAFMQSMTARLWVNPNSGVPWFESKWDSDKSRFDENNVFTHFNGRKASEIIFNLVDGGFR